MSLNTKEEKQVIAWIRQNIRRYRDGNQEDGYSYDCTVAAEVCERDLNFHNHYESILREIEYYVINH